MHTIEEAIEDVRNGKIIIVVDDELVRYRHHFAVHVLGRLVEPDVVAEALAHAPDTVEADENG